jgi:hypothetical protein
MIAALLLFLESKDIMNVVLHQLKRPTIIRIMPHGFTELAKWRMCILLVLMKCWEMGRDMSPLFANIAPIDLRPSQKWI